MSNSPPIPPPTSGSIPEPASKAAGTGSSKPTASIEVSKVTRPLNFIGQIISPASSITIPIKISTSVSETLITSSPDNLDDETIIKYLTWTILKFQYENSSTLLQAASKSGLEACISCGKDGKGVEISFAPVAHAGRILFRAGVVCSSSDETASPDEAVCRAKTQKYLQNCLDLDIDASVELVAITIFIHQENSIPGVCPKEDEKYDTLRIAKLIPVSLVLSKGMYEAVGPTFVADMKARVKKNHHDSNPDVLRRIQADGKGGKCGVCWKKNAVDVQITVLPVLFKGLVFIRCLLICEKEGTMGPCERKAKEYTDKKVELDFQASKEEGFIGGWNKAPVGEKCNQCELRKQGMPRCKACKSVWYCSQACQKLHWKVHKNECVKMRLLDFLNGRIEQN